MNVIMLAAGIGSRLFPLTKDTPKCLLKVKDDETILHRTVRILRTIDPELKLNVVVGFESKKIIDDLNGINIFQNPFFRITNSIASLWFAKELLTNDVVIINADVYLNEDVFRKILATNGNFVVLDSSKICNDADYKIVTSNESVINMGKTIPNDEYFGEYAGISKLNRAGALLLKDKIDEMLQNENYDTWYETALVNLIKDNALDISYLDIKGTDWIEIDSIKDLQYARKHL